MKYYYGFLDLWVFESFTYVLRSRKAEICTPLLYLFVVTSSDLRDVNNCYYYFSCCLL